MFGRLAVCAVAAGVGGCEDVTVPESDPTPPVAIVEVVGIPLPGGGVEQDTWVTSTSPTTFGRSVPSRLSLGLIGTGKDGEGVRRITVRLTLLQRCRGSTGVGVFDTTTDAAETVDEGSDPAGADQRFAQTELRLADHAQRPCPPEVVETPDGYEKVPQRLETFLGVEVWAEAENFHTGLARTPVIFLCPPGLPCFPRP